MAFQGIDVRQTGDRVLFRAFLQDSAGALVTSGTTTLKLYELQNDGTLKSYDFNDNTFRTTALTTETQALTHRQGNNASTDTGLWTYALTTLSGFTAGNLYFAMVNNSGASPTDQQREFLFGVASAFDPYDAVRGGLTSLPNANADTAGGLPISDAGGLDIDTLLGRLDAAVSSRLVSGNVTVGDIVAAALAKFATDDTGETTAVTGSVAKLAQGAGGGDATEAKQDEIITKLNSTPIKIVSPVAAGGEVTLYKGSDYRTRQTTSVDITVDDTGAVLQTKLQDALQVETILFGAGRSLDANDIVGTVDAGTITHAADVTTIKVEITSSQLNAAEIADNYDYHIKAIAPVESGESVGDEEVVVSGTLHVRPERARP